MRASKENCREVIQKFENAYSVLMMNSANEATRPALIEIREFLKKAEKRLPSEKAIEKDKNRKRKKKVK